MLMNHVEMPSSVVKAGGDQGAKLLIFLMNHVTVYILYIYVHTGRSAIGALINQDYTSDAPSVPASAKPPR